MLKAIGINLSGHKRVSYIDNILIRRKSHEIQRLENFE
jgi:hypothetical protein